MCDIGPQKSPTKRVSQADAKVGYRWFYVGRRGFAETGGLFPITSGALCWQSPVARSDRSPRENDDSGLYIFDTLERPLLDKPYAFTGDRYVLGKVRYWGDVAFHTKGVRASSAEIVALAAPNGERVKIREGNPKLKLKFTLTYKGLSRV